MEFLGYIPFSVQAKTLGERIVTSRQILGITQEELAKRLGIDPSTLGRWERNENHPQQKFLEGLEGQF